MIKGVHYVRKMGRPIRWYVYAWRGGPCILKSEGPTKPRLGAAEVSAISAALAERKQTASDTLGALIRSWRGSPADLDSASLQWRQLAPGTRTLWGSYLDVIDTKWGSTPLTIWNDPRMVTKVVEWQDSRSATPRAADIGVQVLSELLAWGRLRGKVKINVASGIPAIYRGSDRAEIIWTAEDLAKAEAVAHEIGRERVFDAIMLATLTGLRRDDLVSLTFDEVSSDAIVRIARKRSQGRRRRAVVPMIPELAALLTRLRGIPRKPGVNTVLVTSRGTPWKAPSLTEGVISIAAAGNIVQPAVPELDQPERRKRLHDCRGTYVTHLCRAGLTNEEIANIVAWSPENVDRIRRTYVDDAAVVVALSERIRQVM